MPAGSNKKREREYEEIKQEFKKEGRYKGRQEEVAARIVNKQRKRAGETKAQRAASTATRRKPAATKKAPSSRSRDGSNADADLPIKRYDAQPVAKIQQQLSKLAPQELRKIETYEHKHKNRSTLLSRIERAREDAKSGGHASANGGTKTSTRSKASAKKDERTRTATNRSSARSSSRSTGSRSSTRRGSSTRSRTSSRTSSNGRARSSGSGGNGRSGSSQTTTDHDTIRRWAEERNASPTSVRGTGDDDEAGVLRLDFPGYSGKDRLEPISWEEFFEKFDEKKLEFLYQDRKKNGEPSNFFKLITPDSKR
jgi:hypothetical protein